MMYSYTVKQPKIVKPVIKINLMMDGSSNGITIMSTGAGLLK